MFTGSEKVAPGEHRSLILSNGGVVNATTSADRTIYFETLPSNQLDLALFLEADRMRSLAVTAKNLDNERGAVQEERRISIDNRPYGPTFEKANGLAYTGFSYRHWIFGSMEDLSAITIDDVKRFLQTYYAPNNAVIALVGDVDTRTALAKIKKYFGAIPRHPPPPAPDLTEPVQTAERRLVLEDKLARLTQVNFAYKGPPAGDRDAAAFDLLDTLLATGESSRLYQRLVRDLNVATLVLSVMEPRVGPTLYHLTATVRQGKTPEELEEMMSKEIERLQSDEPSEAELERARNAALRILTARRESTMLMASHLAEAAVIYNDPRRINSYVSDLLAVTGADIRRVARAYLKPSNRVSIYTVPVKPSSAGPAGSK
jgi:predicted Zn-dependent peptidase